MIKKENIKKMLDIKKLSTLFAHFQYFFLTIFFSG